MKTGRNADKKPYLPLYVDDWFSCPRVRMMTMIQRCAYLELLMMQWRDGWVPTDQGRVARLFPGMPADQIAEVLEAFPDGKNQRLERERSIVTEKIAALSKAGTEGNAKRWRGDRHPIATRSHAEAEAEAEASRAPSEPPVAVAPGGARKARKPASGPNAELLRFWESEWARTRGASWSWSQADAVAMAKCLKLAVGIEDAKDRITRILECQDRWVADNASPRVLSSHWNQYGFKIVHKQRTALQETLEGLEGLLSKDQVTAQKAIGVA